MTILTSACLFVDEKLGDKAYCIIQTKDGDSDSECNGALLQMSRLFLGVEHERTEDEFIESSDGEDDMSYRNSPVPDDTNSMCSNPFPIQLN